MIARTDIVEVRLHPSVVRLVRGLAHAAELGGYSCVRSGSRLPELQVDQFVGQLGECALSIQQTGSVGAYLRNRRIRNADPHRGDDGRDLLGGNIDVKTSLMRSNKDPLQYHLLVRPRERHEENVYVLGLVPALPVREAWVWLVGWCPDAALPTETSRDGRFTGAYAVGARELRPVVSLPCLPGS